jgi:hypothetical protein
MPKCDEQMLKLDRQKEGVGRQKRVF